MLSKKAKYAIKALLALADPERAQPVRIADLAREEQIPPKFLELILLGLKNHGVLQSRKGKGGGYLLARPPSEITLREILVEVPVTDRGVNVAQDDEAKAEADEIRKRLLAGEPFPRLAGELSDAPSKANGGLIGPIKRDELAGELQAVIDKMQVGDVTEVMRTQRGYQILKLESRTETKIRSFDDARADISARVGLSTTPCWTRIEPPSPAPT